MTAFNNIYKILLLFLVLVVFVQNATSQIKQPTSKKPKPKVEVIARSFGDSIMIRWAPNSPVLWDYGNSYGYIIERLTIGYGDQLFVDNPKRLILTERPLRPQTIAQIEPVAMQDDYAAIVAQAIYGENFQLTNNINNSVVSFFNQAQDFQNRFSFSLFAADQSIAAAKAHGLVFTDKYFDPQEKYLYRVYLAAPAGVYKADTGNAYVDPQETFKVPPPMDVEVKFGDGIAELSWNRSFFEQIFTTYFIERSADNGKSYKRISDLPLINTTKSRGYSPDKMYITDSLPQNDKKLIYRVRGVTPFGEISPPSDTVSGMGQSTTPYINPIIVENEIINDDQIKIYWEVQEENAKHIKSLKVLKANNADGPYTTISSLAPTVRTFTDTQPFGTNYYQVAALDKYNRAFLSFPALAQLPDTIPPGPPVNLRGSVDTLGIVTIEWDENTEPDVMGYNVMIANNPDVEFMVVNQELIKQNIYWDTTILNTLTKYVYYKVTAFDNRYNQSEHSAILKLERPDMVPPATAQFTGWSAESNGISLQWENSFSDDVEKYLIYRNLGKDQWTLIAIIDSLKEEYNYTDSEVSIGDTYEYLLVAVDESGLESAPSKVVSVKMHSKGLTPSVEQFYGKADYEEKAINLAWDYDADNVARFLIYRAPEGESIKLYRSVTDGSNAFTDTNIKKGIKYAYRIQALFKTGQQSAISKELIVKY